jgi:hypothetical protein
MAAARDPFPYSLYTWILPEDMRGTFAALVAKGTFPDPKILITGLYVGFGLTVLRVALNAVLLKPLAYKLMGLQK